MAIELQPKNIYLFGCDFGSPSRDSPRSATAAGLNSRELADPRRGSLGKTIFTQSTLELAATIFNTLLSSYRGQCYRIGQGLKLSNALNIDRNKFHDLVLTSSIVATSIHPKPHSNLKVQNISKNQQISCVAENLKGIEAHLDDLFDNLLNLFEAENSWSLKLETLNCPIFFCI